jgi:hypothetical protein
MGILLKLRSHLNLLLEGAALRAIKGEVISEANYKSAIEILTERFGKHQVISAHVDELMILQPCQCDRSSSISPKTTANRQFKKIQKETYSEK